MGAITAGALIQIVTALTALLGAAGAITSLGTAPRLRSSIKRDSDLVQTHPGTDTWQAAMRSSIEKRRYLLLAAATTTSSRVFLLVYLVVNIVGMGILMRSNDERIPFSPAAILAVGAIIGFVFVINESAERIRQARYIAPFSKKVPAAHEAMNELHHAARIWQVFAIAMLGLGVTATATAVKYSLHRSDARHIGMSAHADLIGAGLGLVAAFALMLWQNIVRYFEVFNYRRRFEPIVSQLDDCATNATLLRAGYSPANLATAEGAAFLQLQNELRCKLLQEQALEILRRSGRLRKTGIRRIDAANRSARHRLLHLDTFDA